LTEILGRRITHRRLSANQYRQLYLEEGLELEYAEYLVTVESEVGRGVEEDIFNAAADKKFVGKHTLCEYIEANRDIWIK
jgi:hypothetical protein